MTRVHHRDIPVPAEAIDANGHVNNRAYVRWMQEVATEHSAAVGWPLERYLEAGSSWVVRSHYIEYLRPAFDGEVLHARTWVDTMERRRSRRRYLFTRGEAPEVVVRAETLWVYVDLETGRPRSIPEELRSAFPIVADPTAVPRGLP
jgi:acyl-CoA thioester hydrolase